MDDEHRVTGATSGHGERVGRGVVDSERLIAPERNLEGACTSGRQAKTGVGLALSNQRRGNTRGSVADLQVRHRTSHRKGVEQLVGVDVPEEVTGGSDDFYKFYLVPGGFHGSQGVGATDVPWLDTIVDWVENGNAPDRLVVSKSQGGEVVRTRPLCPYPQRAFYSGAGNTDEAASFECREP